MAGPRMFIPANWRTGVAVGSAIVIGSGLQAHPESASSVSAYAEILDGIQQRHALLQTFSVAIDQFDLASNPGWTDESSSVIHRADSHFLFTCTAEPSEQDLEELAKMHAITFSDGVAATSWKPGSSQAHMWPAPATQLRNTLPCLSTCGFMLFLPPFTGHEGVSVDPVSMILDGAGTVIPGPGPAGGAIGFDLAETKWDIVVWVDATGLIASVQFDGTTEYRVVETVEVNGLTIPTRAIRGDSVFWNLVDQVGLDAAIAQIAAAPVAGMVALDYRVRASEVEGAIAGWIFDPAHVAAQIPASMADLVPPGTTIYDMITLPVHGAE